MSNPFDIEQQQVEVGASIGIALCADHVKEVGTLMKHLDAAKQSRCCRGRNQYKFSVAELA